MSRRPWLGRPLAFGLGMLLTVPAVDGSSAEEKGAPMAEKPMIAWAMVRSGSEAEPEIAVHADGRVELAPRFGGDERRLSSADLGALERFVFEQQRLLEIDQGDLREAVDRAVAARRQAAAAAGAAVVEGAVMDAGTTVLRVTHGGESREYRYHDLAGAAAAYPDAEALQRLRAVETRLLEIAAPR